MSERNDAWALRDELTRGERTVRSVVEASLARIEERNDALAAFYAVDAAGALARADALDAARASGSASDADSTGALFGLPVALKGNMCLAGAEVHCGSRILAGYRPPYTATFVERLQDAGAVVVGMTHLDEFAMGSSGENSAHGVARNPWDVERAPGGSSSGSAVAVAADLVPLALGSDTGGSVRQPAALCGITGFKPSYGRISRYGLVAFGSSLDQVSPFARSARDAALVLSVLGGPDPRDATTLDAPAPPVPAPLDLAGKRIGIPREYLTDDVDADVRRAVESALEELAGLGAEVVEVSLPHTRHAIAAYYVVATAEASSNLARYDGVRYGARDGGDRSLQGMIAATRDAGFGDEVKRRILLGTYVLSSGYVEAWYGRAQRVRGLIAADFAAAFAEVDLICGPTSPTPAFPLGARTEDPVAMYLSDALTVPASLAGLPAISVPCGLVPGDAEDAATPGAPRLPVGLQILGPPGADARVLGCARALQVATDHHHATPAGPARAEGARP